MSSQGAALNKLAYRLAIRSPSLRTISRSVLKEVAAYNSLEQWNQSMWTVAYVSIVIITRGFTIPHLLTLTSICHEPSSLCHVICGTQSWATLCVNWEWTGGWSRTGPYPGPGGGRGRRSRTTPPPPASGRSTFWSSLIADFWQTS